MLDEYKNLQPLFYNYITTSFYNDKISHAYLIETNNVSYSFELAYDLAKFLLCNGKKNTTILNKMDKNIFPNFVVVESENVIKKEQVLNLQKEFSYKSIDKTPKVYLIKDASLLNDSSANSILKFLEDPVDGVIAILLTDKVDKVINTIVSRCQVISLRNSEKFDYKSIFDYYDSETGEIYEEFVEKEYDKFLKFYLNLENKSSLVLENQKIYDLGNQIKPLLDFGLYLYFDAINGILNRDVSKFLPVNNVDKVITDKNNINEIIKKIEVLNKYINLAKYNVNKNLFIDNFVIAFGGDYIEKSNWC